MLGMLADPTGGGRTLLLGNFLSGQLEAVSVPACPSAVSSRG